MSGGWGSRRQSDNFSRGVRRSAGDEGEGSTDSSVDARIGWSTRVSSSPLRRGPKVIWTLLAGLATVMGGITATPVIAGWFSLDSPRPLAGEFNVAVSTFRADGLSGDPTEAERLSNSAVRSVKSPAFGEGPLSVDVAGPADVEKVVGDEQAIGHSGADRLFRALNADLVVGGEMRSTNSETKLLVKLYVNPTRLREMFDAENVMTREIDVPGTIGSSGLAQERLTKLFVRTIDDVRYLAASLGSLAAGRPTVAERQLRRSLSRWEEREGKELPHLLLGHALAEQRRFGPAERHYRRALDFDPAYLRARFSLSEILLQRGSGGCSASSTSAPLLRRARKGYDRVALDAWEPLRTKALFGRARVDVCSSQAGIAARFTEARRDFFKVIAAYRGDKRLLQDEAAESYGWLGLIEQTEHRRGTRTNDELERALRYYRCAATLTTRPDRVRYFQRTASRLRSALSESGRTFREEEC